MHDLDLSTVELFAGVGMLGEGLRAGLDYLGIQTRAVCYVEREAHAAGVLVARMEEGSLDAAPVWSDVTTFPGRLFRGKVDGIVAGFPCQDISVAGQRKGLDGERSGLFFELPRIADDCGAWFMFLENVAGISSATSSVVDEAEGDLFERAAARVVGELADLGWSAEWINVSASDVGANHGRERWFCFAWRELGNARLQHIDLQQRQDGAEHSRASIAMDDAARHGGDGFNRESGSWRGVCEASDAVGNTESHRRNKGGAESGRQQRRPDVTKHGRQVANTTSTRCSGRKDAGADCNDASQVAWCVEFERVCTSVADASSAGQQGNELGRACDGNWGGQEAYGSVSEFCDLFAPGPSDPRWRDILDEFPEVAPALEPTFRSVVNGLAFDMGDSRAARLKCVGNGVVALSAAAAFVVLARRAGVI